VCPQCLRGINRLLALPFQPTVLCGHCGHPVRRTVGAFAQGWARFFFLATFLSVWVLFVVADPLHQQEKLGPRGSVGGGLVTGVVASGLGALAGWLLGSFVGLWVGAPWKDECVPVWRQIQVAANEADAGNQAKLAGAFRARLAAPSKRLTTRRCWHCGAEAEVNPSAGTIMVCCPGCRANLGPVKPNP
jgi:hypothetical protein